MLLLVQYAEQNENKHQNLDIGVINEADRTDKFADNLQSYFVS